MWRYTKPWPQQITILCRSTLIDFTSLFIVLNSIWAGQWSEDHRCGLQTQRHLGEMVQTNHWIWCCVIMEYSKVLLWVPPYNTYQSLLMHRQLLRYWNMWQLNYLLRLLFLELWNKCLMIRGDFYRCHWYFFFSMDYCDCGKDILIIEFYSWCSSFLFSIRVPVWQTI